MKGCSSGKTPFETVSVSERRGQRWEANHVVEAASLSAAAPLGQRQASLCAVALWEAPRVKAGEWGVVAWKMG